MVIIEKEQVRSLLTPEKCITAMEQALTDLENGVCDMPQRLICKMPNGAAFGFMPAYVGDYFGAKVLTAYAPNMGTKYPSHIGYVMLFESEHCTVSALVDASTVTEIRTGCVSAVATRLLARSDAHKLAMIGAGAQARSHLAAIRLVRDITEVTVYDLFPAAAERYAAEMSEKYGIPVKVAANVAEAVADADIICTLCPAKEPYLTRDMVKPGVHINAVGTFSPVTREVASDLVAAARLYSDHTPATRAESGEYLIPLQEGLITEDHILGSVGQLLLGRAQGRTGDDDITVFDALGLAVEDVASAKLVYLESLC
ncbi:MAG: ornithine cyclodeaminase family protein [Oscillospiraceae bacterium]|nr:ornithine cyclodeaminase family protein [Oscillospiraceae bacterium]